MSESKDTAEEMLRGHALTLCRKQAETRRNPVQGHCVESRDKQRRLHGDEW